MNKKITTLGIHYNTHDSSVALIQNGEIHAVVKEESIKNIKHLGGYPIERI
jgi:predicted NodU family carbamoyl transferase